MEHDLHYWCTFMGAPVLLYGNWIAFTEGTDFNICNYGLDGASMSEEKLEAVIQFARNNLGVKYLDIWSDSSLKVKNPSDWLYNSFIEDSSNIPIQFDLARYNSNPRIKYVRRALKRGYLIQEYSGRSMTAEHIKIVKSYFNSRKFSAFDVSFIGNIATLFESPYAFSFDIKLDEKLIAFGTVSKYLDNCWVFVHLFMSEVSKYASDLAYHHILSRAKDSGVKTLDIGYTIDDGLFKYKESLGANRIFPPTSFYQMYDPNSKLDEHESFHWRLREVMGVGRI